MARLQMRTQTADAARAEAADAPRSAFGLPPEFTSERLSPISVARLLRIVALLWACYVVILAAIDWLFVAAQPGVSALPPQYYALHLAMALVVLALSAVATARTARVALPLAIVCMAALPTLGSFLIAPGLPVGPLTSAEGLALRSLPVLFIALTLVAWRYRWGHVVLFSLGTAAIELAPIAVQALAQASAPGPAQSGQGAPSSPPLTGAHSAPELTVVLIQTVSFLVIGSCICLLMNRLRAQTTSLARANAQLRHYASTLEKLTVSRERNRVARELHDTLAHTLSGLAVHLETTKAYWDADPAAAKAMLDTAVETARGGLQETRRALKALRASPLDDLGLALALRQLAESTAESGHLALALRLPERLPPLPADVEQCVYRIAQEALANAAQHAGARNLEVELAPGESALRLVIRDDGRGLDVRRGERAGHFGLSGMRERAQSAGGELTVRSAPGQGTIVQLVIGELTA